MSLVHFQKFFNRSLFSLNNAHYQFSIAKYSDKTVTFRYDSDPGKYFINPEIQKLLKSMTRMQLDKVFRKRSVPDNTIEYKFMTTEQLENEFKKAVKRAQNYLKMPPVVKVMEDKRKIISKDPGIKNFSDSKYVITDITFGLKQTDRKILIRQIDGTLEYAPLQVQKRINQTYFPLHGRKIRTPRIFESLENLKHCLDEYKYEFILDRLCIQYEPYEKDYHDISEKIYTHINEHKKFDLLRSTRHFGPMVFFLAWHQIIDDLLYDMIKRDYLRNGVELISLMYILNNINYDKKIHEQLSKIPETNIDNVNHLKRLSLKQVTNKISDDVHEEIQNVIGKNEQDFEADDLCLKFIEDFVKTRSLKKVQLELAIETFKEENDEKRKLCKALKKAHGTI